MKGHVMISLCVVTLVLIASVEARALAGPMGGGGQGQNGVNLRKARSVRANNEDLNLQEDNHDRRELAGNLRKARSVQANNEELDNPGKRGRGGRFLEGDPNTDHGGIGFLRKARSVQANNENLRFPGNGHEGKLRNPAFGKN